MPLPVVAVITAKPGSEGVVRDALEKLVGPTRAEQGCLSYDLYVSTEDPATFITVESWRGPADVEQHMASDHIAATFAAAGDALANPPAIHSLEPIVAG